MSIRGNRVIKSTLKKYLQGLVFLLSVTGIPVLSCRQEEIKKKKELTDGVNYTLYQHPVSMTRIHVLEADLSRKDLRISALKAGKRLRTTLPLSELVRGLPDPGSVVAAVNGDFFSLEGIPSGAQVQDGKIVKDAAESWFAFGIPEPGLPFIAQVRFEGALISGRDTLPIHGFNRPRLNGETVLYNSFYGNRTGTNVYGDELILSAERFSVGAPMTGTVLQADSVYGNNVLTDSTVIISTHGQLMRPVLRRLKTGQPVTVMVRSRPDYGRIRELIGGYPLLVHQGKNMIRRIPSPAFGFIRDKYARTAVGISAGKKKMYWLCAEGDPASVNRGLNLEELAEYMIRIGCESAVNLDGGGSVTMMTGKKLVTQSEEGTGRSISNALILSRIKSARKESPDK